MATAQHDTARVTFLKTLKTFIGKAHEHAQTHEWETNSVTTWLSAVWDSGRKGLEDQQKAADSPLAYGISDKRFYKLVDKVLRGRVDDKELDDFVNAFKTTFWPMEETWRNLAKKTPEQPLEIMERILTGENWEALTNDTGRLVHWAKNIILDLYWSNKYHEAVLAGNAILHQLSHLNFPKNERTAKLLALATSRISFFVELAQHNIGHVPIFCGPLNRYYHDLSQIENLALAHEWENIQILRNATAVSGVHSPETLMRYQDGVVSALAFYNRIAVCHGLSITDDHAKIASSTAPRPMQEEFTQSANATIEACQKQWRDIDMKTLPSWLSDPDLVLPLATASARWIGDQSVILPERFRMFADEYHERMTLVAQSAAFFHQSMGGKSTQLLRHQSTSLLLEQARVALNRNNTSAEHVQIAGKLIMGATTRIAPDDPLVSWSNLYAAAAQYFIGDGHQYGAVKAWDQSRMAAASADNEQLRTKRLNERRALLDAEIGPFSSKSSITKQLIEFVDADQPASVARGASQRSWKSDWSGE